MNSCVEEVRRKLAEAQNAYRALLTRGRSSKVSLNEYTASHERVLGAERDLAAATSEQYAVPVDLGFLPEAGVSAPMLLQNDCTTVLTFSAVRLGPDGSRSATGTAIIEFERCQWTSFGYPNDEALPGHPLYGRGLSTYGIFTVKDSHWVRRMFEQNKITFPNAVPWDVRHLVFPFHDSTFECICQDIKAASLSTEPYQTIIEGISRRLASDLGFS